MESVAGAVAGKFVTHALVPSANREIHVAFAGSAGNGRVMGGFSTLFWVDNV